MPSQLVRIVFLQTYLLCTVSYNKSISESVSSSAETTNETLLHKVETTRSQHYRITLISGFQFLFISITTIKKSSEALAGVIGEQGYKGMLLTGEYPNQSFKSSAEHH